MKDGAPRPPPARLDPSPADPARGWRDLRRLTPARVALGRVGAALPTDAWLAFALDHARARDAVHAPFDADAVAACAARLGLTPIAARSRASDRTLYLRRPDLGRRLDAPSVARLDAAKGACDLAFVIGDGLSATAVHNHACALLAALLPRLSGLTLGPVAVARGARVALGDEIGALVGARLILVLIGERPGLSAPDSLGAYLTYAPRLGRSDAERNCVSNIRPAGLGYDAAAHKCAWLARQALARAGTGVRLRDESGAASAAITDASDPRRESDN